MNASVFMLQKKGIHFNWVFFSILNMHTSTLSLTLSLFLSLSLSIYIYVEKIDL